MAKEDLVLTGELDISKIKDEIEELQKRAKKALDFKVDNKDLKQNQKDLNKINKQIADIESTMAKNEGTRVKSEAWKNLNKQVDEYNKKIEGTETRLANLREKKYAEDSKLILNAREALAGQKAARGPVLGRMRSLESRGKDTVPYEQTQAYKEQVQLLDEKRKLLRANLIPIEKEMAVQDGITAESNRQSLAEQENAAQIQKLKDDLEKVEDEWRKVRTQAEAIRNREFGAVRDDDIPRGANTKYDSLRDKMRSLVSTMAELEGKIYELEYGVKESGNSFADSGNKVSTYADRLKEADTAVKSLFDGVELDLDEVKEHVNGVQAVARALYELRNSGKELSGNDVVDIMEEWSKSAKQASADWDALRDVLAGFSEGARKSAEYLKPDTLDMYKTVIRGVANQLNIAGEAVDYLTRATQASSFSDEEKARALAQLTEWATNCKNAIEALYQAQGEQGATEERAQEIADLEAQLAKLNGQIAEFNGEPISIEMPDVAKVENTLLGMIVRLRELKAEQAKLEKVSSPTLAQAQQYEKNRVEIEELTEAIKHWGEEMEQISSTQEKTANSSGRLSATVNKLSISSLGLKDVFKNMSKYMKSAEKSHNQFSRSLKHGLSNITKYVFGFRSLFFLIRRLRSVVKEGVQNLVQYDSANNETNKAMTELQTSLLFLKNAWGAAFAPILNVVLPILSSLLDMIAAVGNAIARLIATLTGQETVIQAVKVKTEDYADSLKSAGGGASKTSKAAEKLHDRLAAFDDLNVLGKDDETDPNKSGGGGGGGNALTPSINDMFERVTAQSTLADMLKESWVTGDFSSVGKLIGEKIKESLYSIPWDDIKATAHKIGFGGGTFLTGLFGDPDTFSAIGHTIAEGLNTVSEAIGGFFEGYEAGGFGSGVAAAIKSFFTDTDWGLIGKNVSSAFSVANRELGSFLKDVDLRSIRNAIEDFIRGFDTEDFVESLRELEDGIYDIVNDAGQEFADLLWDISHGAEESRNNVALLAPALVILADALNELSGGSNGATVELLLLGPQLFVILGFVKKLCDAIELLKDRFKVSLEDMMKIWNQVLLVWFMPFFAVTIPLVRSIITEFANECKFRVTLIVVAVRGAIEVIKKTAGGLFQFVFDNYDLIVDGFNEMGDGISSAWDWIQGIFVDGTNSVLGTIESWANAMIDVINAVLDAFASFDIPIDSTLVAAASAAGITGLIAGSLDFNVGSSRFSHISVPRLAQGAVIPANNEFMAILGDQKHGTNIEAPLDTIKQAVAEVLAGSGNAEMIRLLQQLIMVVESKNLTIGDKEIGQANARYQTRQNIIRGVRGV